MSTHRYTDDDVPCACKGNYNCNHTAEGSECYATVSRSGAKRVRGLGALCNQCFTEYLNVKKHGGSYQRREMESVLADNKKEIDRLEKWGMASDAYTDRLRSEVAEIEHKLRLEDALRSAEEDA